MTQEGIETEVTQWLRTINIIDIGNVKNMFYDFGLETLDDLRDLDTIDVLELRQNIKKISDRNKIKIHLDILRSHKTKPNPNKIMVRDKEERYLKKLQIYLAEIDSIMTGFNKQIQSLDHDVNKAKQEVDIVFNKLHETLENRRKVVINSIEKRRDIIKRGLVDEEMKYKKRFIECNGVLMELNDIVYKTPISSDCLGARADTVVDAIKNVISKDVGKGYTRRKESVYFTDYGLLKVMSMINKFGGFGDIKCPVSFTLELGTKGAINVNYEMNDDIKDYSNSFIQISYKNTNSEADYRVETISPMKNGIIPINVSQNNNLWSFRARYYDSNTRTWSLYSDLKSIDINSKPRNIVIKADNIMTTLPKSTVEYPPICFNDTIKFGTHIYDFKIIDIPNKRPWSILFNIYHADSMSNVKHYINNKKSKPNYIAVGNGCIRQEFSENNIIINTSQNNDIILRIGIDLDNNKISFTRNNARFKKAFDIIKDASYKLGITLENHECCVKFVSHKKI